MNIYISLHKNKLHRDITDINLKARTINILVERIEENLYDLGLSMFGRQDAKSSKHKEEFCDLLNNFFKKIQSSKDPVKEMNVRVTD